MQASESNLSKKEQKKRIRERYRGINQDELVVIPAKPKEDIFKTDVEKRVAVYARVSTDDPNQTSSYELQRNHYEDMITRHANWTLVNIYADEGISGTSLSHRDSFKQMIADCEAGMIDLIITKSVARFARNIEDCIHYTRWLKNRKSPIGVLFENESIYTLNPDSEMQLSFIATMAQEESHTKAVIMNGSIEMRFRRGIFLTPVLLGYDHDEFGNLVINEEEAKTVRLIFLMYLSGYNCTEIAEYLTKQKRLTKRENTEWSQAAISRILRNERYCGDVIAHKTFTPDYLNHKSVKNCGDVPQYCKENHHEAIISRADFFAVQKLLDVTKFGCKNLMPELKVIDNGVLKGFVEVNPCWMGFTSEDYYAACHSVLTDEDYLNPTIQIRHEAGDFNFIDYEVTRGQFAANAKRICMVCSADSIKFSTEAINNMSGVEYIELLYHPLYQIFTVRKTTEQNLHALKWFQSNKERTVARKIKGNAFMGIIYELCGWNRSFQYQLQGYVKEKENERVLMFYADEPEMRISRSQLEYLLEGKDELTGKKYKRAFPTEWTKTFGMTYDECLARTISVFDDRKSWQTDNAGIIANKSDFEIRSDTEVRDELEKLMKQVEAEVTISEGA